MLELIVFVKVAGANVRFDNLNDMITSFVSKNKNLNYKFYFVAGCDQEKNIMSILKSIGAENKILDIVCTDNSWAVDFNIFFDAHKDNSKWLLIAHDDVEFVTDNYFIEIAKSVQGHEEYIGWITSTSEYYYKEKGKMVTDTFRPGFHKDYSNWGAMWQLHYNDLNKIDYPTGPVRIHGPMSAIMITTMESMKKIGHCENWTQYTMLIDEDWSLEALKNNLWNVWVPHVYHRHPNRFDLRKKGNRWVSEASLGFREKWGFEIGSPKKTGWKDGVSVPIEDLKEKYKNTDVLWSHGRNSYEWVYLDER